MTSPLVLGLDISSSVTGIAVLEHSTSFDSQTHVRCLRPIDMTKLKGLWTKVEFVNSALVTLHEEFPTISELCIEEPLKNFSSGLSSADTITSLIRFNGIVSYLCRQMWHVDPTYVNASHARKLLGVGVKRTALVGKNAKTQTFEHVMATELSHVTWPTKKKSGKTVDWAMDVVDAYVVARSVFHT